MSILKLGILVATSKRASDVGQATMAEADIFVLVTARYGPEWRGTTALASLWMQLVEWLSKLTLTVDPLRDLRCQHVGLQARRPTGCRIIASSCMDE